ncbi:MAG: TonB-dependent receptor [Bacteroidales bacterium]|nr:TonB-dependent receptor [Bacteroidales bacterium]
MKKVFLLLVLQLGFIIAYSQFQITGKVVDLNGNPLPGTNIQVENTFRGTYCDIKGNFSISNLKKGTYFILISYMGYEKIREKINLENDLKVNFKLKKSDILTDEVIVSATRAGDKVPATYMNLQKKELEENNLGQDIPYIISLTPSLVTTSDAGTGIGYTNFRIRGTDANRINITINGIPLNDSESHGVWWVNMPDFTSSVDNVQIQRGVGTSTNGAAAFGATINFQTLTLNSKPYAKIGSTFGSFNTLRNNISVGSGLINDKFTFDARLSKIHSDGFIDRAWSDLKSFYISGGYYTGKSIIKLNVFSGIEETYQAWWGVPSVRLNNDEEGMKEYLDNWLYSEQEYEHMLNSNSRTYNYYTYDNEIDHYQQDHYQLLFSREITNNLNFNTAIHYTKGRGYYEQYKEDESFGNYQLNNLIIGIDTITKTDLIRRKWLDNDFYGFTYSLNYKSGKADATLGGAWNKYDGEHFGRIIWSQYASNGAIRHEWYNSTGLKTDFNIFGKINYRFTKSINLYGDIQYRKINYIIDGIDDDLRDITQEHNFDFINPKLGVFYTLNDFLNAYLSFGIANREPNRSNYTDADPSKPSPTNETLYDYELGYTYSSTNTKITTNFFFMDYKNQLVLTGEINDVGAAIMTNVNKSYRQGFEFVSEVKILDDLKWNFNLTLSKSKIKNFNEYVDNWNYWDDTENEPLQYIKEIGETNLSFSPNIIFNNDISYEIINGLSINLITNYVGKQYIDNTSDNDRKLDAYIVNNFRINYSFTTKWIKECSFQLLINNILNEEYETNAWIYRYIYNGEAYKMDGYFPQAGRNFLAGISLKF